MFRLKTDIAEFYKNDAKFITEKTKYQMKLKIKILILGKVVF